MHRLAALLGPICLALSFADGAAAGDWPTFGYDPARTGWARSERTLGPENVGNLELKWKTEVDDESEYLVSLTAPVVGTGVSTRLGVRDVVYVAGKQGGVFALDSATGEQLWDWKPTLYQLPTNNGLQGSVYCPNGVNATPTLDVRSGILYT
ncbi:MAG: PQQ-binding-like beta-propeller repeat protein, partial [Acidobacteriia bacterium]|nr:PQQ-binding-like beta-propeller repeat protein [Terriglobia bacterium]